MLQAKPVPPAPWAQTDHRALVARRDATVHLERVVRMVQLGSVEPLVVMGQLAHRVLPVLQAKPVAQVPWAQTERRV